MADIVDTQTTATGRSETIRLTVPCRPGFAQIARLTVTSIAARSGFTYDEIEDLRIAVGELCGVLVADAPDGRLTIACTAEGDDVMIEATRTPGSPVHLGGLSSQILAAVTDRVEADPSTSHIVVHKRRQV